MQRDVVLCAVDIRAEVLQLGKETTNACPSVVVYAFAGAHGCVSRAAAKATSVILGNKSNLGSTWPADYDRGTDKAY